MEKDWHMIYGENSPGIREIMYALEDECEWMEFIRDNGKDYVKLIDFLLSERVINGDPKEGTRRRKTVSDYASRLGEKPATVNKWFRQIYADIFDLNEEHPELFVNEGEQRCAFFYCSKYDKSGFWFNLGVKNIPRVGDRFEFSFPKAVTATSVFFVKEVAHRHEHGKVEIEIELRGRYFKGESYRDLLVDKALFLEMISIGDVFGPDYMLDDKLKELFKGRNMFEFI